MTKSDAVDARALTELEAEEVVSSLRSGVPPRRFASTYSTGWSDFLGAVRRRHLSRPGSAGKIRFISGSWGSGKTHLLRLLAEQAFDSGYLVSTVELNKDEAPFNKFEHVFSRVVRGVTTPEMYQGGDLNKAVPFGDALRHALLRARQAEEPLATLVARERARLMENEGIDIDFRRAVGLYWDTFSPTAEEADSAALQETRGSLLQWFTGEGTLATYRKPYGLMKVVDRANAHLMLQSLARFAQHCGYGGVLVLLDEAEMSFSVMRRSDLRLAHNNLLHLINGVADSAGMFLVYAATPDFFDDPKHGIQQYGALAMRIGSPENQPPGALDRVWNVDAAESSEDDYRAAAFRLRDLYIAIEPADEELLPSESELATFVDDLVRNHPRFSSISVWRMLVTAAIREFDNRIQGRAPRDGAQAHADTMAEFRDD